MNQAIRFDQIIIVDLLKMINGLDREKVANKNQNWTINALVLFVNISQYMKDQRLEFDPLDVIGHIKRVYGPDIALVTQIVEKSRKRTAFLNSWMHCCTSVMNI